MSGFTIPNEPGLAHPELADVDSGDFDIIVAGVAGNGVVEGCTTVQLGSPAMGVSVATGVVRIDDVDFNVPGGNETIGAADTTYARKDLIAVNSSGDVVVLTGTPAVDSMYPDIPVGHVVLAEVFVPANATTITTARIVDKRMVLPRVPDAGDIAYDPAPGMTSTLVQDAIDELAGRSEHYRHLQSVPSTVWTVTHNLGFKPNVDAEDSAGDQIFGDVHHIDNNSLTITYTVATGGAANLS